MALISQLGFQPRPLLQASEADVAAACPGIWLLAYQVATHKSRFSIFRLCMAIFSIEVKEVNKNSERCCWLSGRFGA
jgi:hypothetical protein